ncbi:MAG: hypothetical protein KME30_14125 [Iphinoe sp. HA4291-MV1]|jgi:hypothetical protein|nr:hypothetical protein [Iphinoe sp. HA4291-MV1]
MRELDSQNGGSSIVEGFPSPDGDATRWRSLSAGLTAGDWRTSFRGASLTRGVSVGAASGIGEGLTRRGEKLDGDMA